MFHKTELIYKLLIFIVFLNKIAAGMPVIRHPCRNQLHSLLFDDAEGLARINHALDSSFFWYADAFSKSFNAW